jgi:hypothetical protein
MAEDIERSRGRSKNYKMDRGGVPAEFGPFYGVVKNTSDSIRSGRIQVFIEAFADGGMDDDDQSKWTTVNYMPPFFGSTPYNPSSTGIGSYIDGNSNSYGMWFTPPDVGITVLCVFVNGDRSQGFYIGVAPDQSIGHMVPAIGASTAYVTENENQGTYFEGAIRLPVVEINTNNIALEESPRFFDKPKPVQSVVAQTMFQQGLIKDPERGPIGSSSQRESPSAVYGISTPGTPVYQGGLKPGDIQEKIDSGEVQPQDLKVIGRVGGHSFVMDDGDIDGTNKLLRFRTSAGHQITMSDSGSFFYITHANGLTWFELGSEGTLDVYATNSINLRTRGDINFHADRDINMYAGRNISMKAGAAKPYEEDGGNIKLEAVKNFTAMSQEKFKIQSKSYVGIKSDGSIAISNADNGSWNGGSGLIFSAGGIDLNGPAAPAAEQVDPITKVISDDTKFSTSKGWEVDPEKLESIVSRAPTHEPFPYHNKGVDVEISLEEGKPTPPPGAIPVPAGVEITRES